MPTFDVKCTLPPPGTTFVRPPDTRGTLDIVYSCLTIIVLCTWSVMPLNVPTQYKSMPGRQTHMRTLRRTLNKLKWLAFNILGPEWPFIKALNSRNNAKRLERKFDIYKGVDDVVWTRSHTQLANMGGFVVVFGPGAEKPAGQVDAEGHAHPVACISGECCGITSLWSCWSYRHAIIRRLLLLRRDYLRFTESLSTDQRFPYGGSFGQEIPLVSSDRIAQTTPYRTRELLGRGVIVGYGCPHALETPCSCGKIEWLLDDFNTMNFRIAYNEMLQGGFDDTIDNRKVIDGRPEVWLTNPRVLCGDRWYLDANQLLLARELGIIGKLPRLSTDRVSDLNKEDIFVKLLAISQITWLCLQLSMRLLHGVPTTQLEIMTLGYALCSAMTYFLLFDRPKDVQTVFEIEAVRYPTPEEMSRIANIGPAIFSLFRTTVSLPNHSVHCNGDLGDIRRHGSFAAALYGSLHFAAWNYKFPTQTERTLWRASTILTVTVIPAMYAITLLGSSLVSKFHLNSHSRPWIRSWANDYHSFFTFGILAPLFVAARIFILVEVVLSLAYQPSESYKPRGPHISLMCEDFFRPALSHE